MRRAHRAALLSSIGVFTQIMAARATGAQGLVVHERAGEPARAPVNRSVVGRMAVGERAIYALRLAGRNVGTGSLEVLGTERIGPYNTFHTRLQVSGGVLFARVNDRFESWIDPERIFSRRFVQDQKELRNTRYREYHFAPERRTYRQMDSGEDGTLSSSEPLDDVSFLFYARTLRLHVGDVVTIPRYFKEGHDVILRVLRKERIMVPAGTYETIVVQPTITNAGGLFGQGGHAEIYFSDDSVRTLVMLRSRVPAIGSLSLHLKEFRAGR
ncbi:MAG TPA: DUF3108 domain-containing protein [Gemmatimonadaceae bacterium]|nr:DUF3108 domain-containing protein [Gemmatimonadaceae bacterium]